MHLKNIYTHMFCFDDVYCFHGSLATRLQVIISLKEAPKLGAKGATRWFQNIHWSKLVYFYEYFYYLYRQGKCQNYYTRMVARKCLNYDKGKTKKRREWFDNWGYLVLVALSRANLPSISVNYLHKTKYPYHSTMTRLS